jgi:hypothetical protein
LHAKSGAYFIHKNFKFSKQKKENPAYGTIPTSVGKNPRYKALTPPS